MGSIEIAKRRIEGTRLALLTPTEYGLELQQTFANFVLMFARRKEFTSTMAPFARRKVGPEWFTRPHPKSSGDPHVEEHTIMWEAFLTPRIMPLRFKSSKTHLSLIAYQPNLVSRQFGIIQSLPSPIFPKEKSMLYWQVCRSNSTFTIRLST